MVDRCRMAAVQHRDVEWGRRLRGHQYAKEPKAKLVDKKPLRERPCKSSCPRATTRSNGTRCPTTPTESKVVARSAWSADDRSWTRRRAAFALRGGDHPRRCVVFSSVRPCGRRTGRVASLAAGRASRNRHCCVAQRYPVVRFLGRQHERHVG